MYERLSVAAGEGYPAKRLAEGNEMKNRKWKSKGLLHIRN
jgi:hypothetical protein